MLLCISSQRFSHYLGFSLVLPEHTRSLYPGGHLIPCTFSIAYSSVETSSHFLEYVQACLVFVPAVAHNSPCMAGSFLKHLSSYSSPGGCRAMWSESLPSGSSTRWHPPQRMPCFVICLLSCVLSPKLWAPREKGILSAFVT